MAYGKIQYDPRNITAEITARGPDSMVPDNAGAVDATVYLSGEVIGEVTLLPDPGAGGALSTWGAGWHHWADSSMRRALDEAINIDTFIGDVVAAVREAAEPKGAETSDME